MLDSLFRLGQTIPTSMNVYLDAPNAKNVIGIIFDKNSKYKTSKSFVFTKKSDFLYRKDPSGRPGLFLTGRVSWFDIKNLQKDIENDNKSGISEFVKKKIAWFPNGKLLNKRELLDSIPKETKDEILEIMINFKKSFKEIAGDVLSILNSSKAETTLLTIMTLEGRKPQFVGQNKRFSALFKKFIFEKKFKTKDEKLVCITCNEEKIIDTFEQNPLPFYTTNKPMFSPGASHEQSKKGFAVCDGCYTELQKGWRFTDENLNFHIPFIDSKKALVSFWLIPQLNDQKLMKLFKKSLSKKTLYLNQIKDLCEKLDTVTTWDVGGDDVNSFLKFSTLYYTVSDYGLMQPINEISGIYPKRLVELLEVKKEIDSSLLFMSNEVKFGFPSLATIYRDSSPQWEDQLIQTISEIFIEKPVEINKIIKIINFQTETHGFKQRNINQITSILLQGLQIIEYLIKLNHQPLQVNKMSDIATANNRQILFYQRCIKDRPLLNDDTARAICAIGTSVGIITLIQKRDRSSQSFWTNLNRLDQNLTTVLAHYPKVKTLLSQYNNHDYDELMNFLGAEMINFDPDSDIPREQVNFVFSLGMAFGQLIAEGKLR